MTTWPERVAAVKHDADCAVFGSYVNGTDCGRCDCDRDARIGRKIEAALAADRVACDESSTDAHCDAAAARAFEEGT